MIEIKDVSQKGDIVTVTAVFDFEEGEKNFLLHVDAIGSRMVMYEIDSPQDALQAIMREHYGRESREFSTPTTFNAAVKAMNGELKKVKVTGLTKADTVLEKNKAKIRRAYKLRGGK